MTKDKAIDRAWQELIASLDELNEAALDICNAARTPDDVKSASIILQMAIRLRGDAMAQSPAVSCSSLLQSPIARKLVRG